MTRLHKASMRSQEFCFAGKAPRKDVYTARGPVACWVAGIQGRFHLLVNRKETVLPSETFTPPLIHVLVIETLGACMT